MKRQGLVLLCFGAVALARCQTADDGESASGAAATPQICATLTAAELRSELVGSSFAFTSTDGATADIRFGADGSLGLSNATFPGISSDQGTWRIQGNSLCASWTTIRSGAENCLRYVRGANGTYTTDTGTLRRT